MQLLIAIVSCDFAKFEKHFMKSCVYKRVLEASKSKTEAGLELSAKKTSVSKTKCIDKLLTTPHM